MRFVCSRHRTDVVWDRQVHIDCPQCRAEMGWTPEEKKVNYLLDDIQEIRARNNKNWMGIMRLAFKHAPRDVRILMMRITEADQEINKLTKQLGEVDYGEEKETEGDPNTTSSASGCKGSNFWEGPSPEGISQE